MNKQERERRRTRRLVEKAVKILGSQAALGRAVGIKQQGISYLLHEADRVTAEMAVLIEMKTKGKVKREKLRPDLYEPFVRKETAGKPRSASHPVVVAGEAESITPAPNLAGGTFFPEPGNQ